MMTDYGRRQQPPEGERQNNNKDGVADGGGRCSEDNYYKGFALLCPPLLR
jgi:hypothetical protein